MERIQQLDKNNTWNRWSVQLGIVYNLETYVHETRLFIALYLCSPGKKSAYASSSYITLKLWGKIFIHKNFGV